jgi:hypothetical protein
VTMDPAVAVPAGISEDGQVVVGTIYVLQGAGFSPVFGFKWTIEDGMKLFDDVPDYEGLITLAYATNRDGSVIIGHASTVGNDRQASWVWTAGNGYQFIPEPEDTIDSYLHDVTADGSMILGSFLKEDNEGHDVRDLFIWSMENGFVSLDVGYAGIQLLPVGIADNGLSIAYNCLTVDDTLGRCSNEGTWTLQSNTLTWGGSDTYVINPPPVGQSDHQFWASDMSSDEFGYYMAHSSDLGVIGGYSNIDIETIGLVNHASVWKAAPGQLNILTGLGWPGRTDSVSPDGTLAGFSRHFMQGSPYAFIWSADSGTYQLYALMQRADEALGSNLLETFSSGQPSYLTGFSADNEKVVGVSFNFEGTNMFGFMIDNLSQVVP